MVGNLVAMGWWGWRRLFRALFQYWWDVILRWEGSVTVGVGVSNVSGVGIGAESSVVSECRMVAQTA